MEEDDLPPAPRQEHSGFGGALGSTLSGFLWIAIFIAILAAALLGLKHWL
jgi:hypothetical protein